MDAPSKPQPRPFLRIAQGLAVLALAAFTLHAGFGLGGAGTDGLFNDYVYNGLMALAAASCLLRAVRIREARPAWTILGLGLAAWTSAEIYNSLVLAKLEEPPYPSLSDYLWLTFYPASYVAMVLLVRGHMRKARTSMWLDGVVAALAVCAIGEVTVFHTVAENAIVGDNAALATDLAYPAGDMMMLAIVATVFALTAWRPGRAWGMIGLGPASPTRSPCTSPPAARTRSAPLSTPSGSRPRSWSASRPGSARAAGTRSASTAGASWSSRSRSPCRRSGCSCTTTTSRSTTARCCSPP
jgi:hypothetical protein